MRPTWCSTSAPCLLSGADRLVLAVRSLVSLQEGTVGDGFECLTSGQLGTDSDVANNIHISVPSVLHR
jgi:hypothetical protein